MINAYYVEVREKNGEKIVREVEVHGRKTRKHVRVYRGKKLVSEVNKPLNPTEKKNVQAHMFTPSLFTSLNRKTIRNMNRKTIRSINKKTIRNMNSQAA